MRFRFASLAAFGAICLLAGLNAPAHAQLDFTFTLDALTGTQNGSALLFKINLSNGAMESAITGLNVLFDNGTLPNSLIDTDPFLTNASIPDPLPENYSEIGLDFFNVSLSNVDPGTYTGTATLSYTTDGITTTDVNRGFTVNVEAPPPPPTSTVPEPGTLGLLAAGVGIPALALVRRRRIAAR